MKTIFFAAGATIPFFEPKLSTQSITDAVCSQQNWENIINQLKQEKSGTPIYNPINDITTLRGLGLNFEQIAEVIDKIASLNIHPNPIANNPLGIIARMLNWQVPYEGWIYVPFLYREIIARYILDLEDNHKRNNYDALIEKQRNFINSVKTESGDDCSIISLNYDNCVKNSLNGLGIEHYFNGQNSELDINNFMNSSNVVYYPHGHICFKFTDNRNISYYQDPHIAKAERWNGIVNSVNTHATLPFIDGQFALNFNTFITTGKTKDEALNNLPYAVYYQRMAIDFFKSDTIYIIGYSFSDEHFNRLLKTYIACRRGRLVIVNHYPDDVTMTNEYMDEYNIIRKIYDVFKPEWDILLDNEGTVHPFDQQEIDRINNQGWGNIFDNVTFYKKGYEDFLNEYHNVM